MIETKSLSFFATNIYPSSAYEGTTHKSVRND